MGLDGALVRPRAALLLFNTGEKTPGRLGVWAQRRCAAQSMRGMTTDIPMDTNITAARTWLSTHSTSPYEEGEKPTHHLPCRPPATRLSAAAGYSSAGHGEGFIASQKRKPNFLASPAEHPTHFANPLVVLVIYDYQQQFSRPPFIAGT